MSECLMTRRGSGKKEIKHYYNSATVENNTKYYLWLFGATQGGGAFTITGATTLNTIVAESGQSGATWNDTYWRYQEREILTTSTTLKITVSGGTGTLFMLQKEKGEQTWDNV